MKNCKIEVLYCINALRNKKNQIPKRNNKLPTILIKEIYNNKIKKREWRKVCFSVNLKFNNKMLILIKIIIFCKIIT